MRLIFSLESISWVNNCHEIRASTKINVDESILKKMSYKKIVDAKAGDYWRKDTVGELSRVR